MKYSEIVGVEEHFKSAFDITSDVGDSWKTFISNDKFENNLGQIVKSFTSPVFNNRKSIWVQGTYGTGKSHSLAVIEHLLCDDYGEIEDYLPRINKAQIRNEISNFRKEKKVFPVVLKGIYAITDVADLTYIIQQQVAGALKQKNIEIATKTDFQSVIQILKRGDLDSFFNNLISKNIELQGYAANKDQLITVLEKSETKVIRIIADELKEAGLGGFRTHNIIEWLTDVKKELKNRGIADYLMLLYNVCGIVPAKSSPEDFYKKLLVLLKKSEEDNLEAVILKKINAQKITEENVYSLWKNSDEFARWLIQNYILKFRNDLEYLCTVMNSIDNLSSEGLVESVYTCIFEHNNNNTVNERKKIIRAINKVEQIRFTDRMSAYYEKIINSVVKNKTTYDIGEIKFEQEFVLPESVVDSISSAIQSDIIPMLTDCSDYERRLTIWLYRGGLISNTNIQEIYPQLEEYFDSDNMNLQESSYSTNLKTYFDIYRKARLYKGYFDNYNIELIKWNKNEDTFYSWYTDPKLEYPETILKKHEFTGNTYVLDGVGAEFMEYIVNLLYDHNIEIEYCAYSKSHLPSITSIAKKSYSMKNNWILDYDKKVVHGQFYYPVTNIEAALSVIKSMISDILIEEGENRFAITADHGATVGHKIFKKEKKYNFSDADHDGRCYLVPLGTSVNSSDDYLLYTDDENREWNIESQQELEQLKVEKKGLKQQIRMGESCLEENLGTAEYLVDESEELDYGSKNEILDFGGLVESDVEQTVIVGADSSIEGQLVTDVVIEEDATATPEVEEKQNLTIHERVEQICETIVESGKDYEKLSFREKAEVFHFDLENIADNLEVHRGVLAGLGIKYSGADMFEDYQGIYDEAAKYEERENRMEKIRIEADRSVPILTILTIHSYNYKISLFADKFCDIKESNCKTREFIFAKSQ